MPVSESNRSPESGNSLDSLSARLPLFVSWTSAIVHGSLLAVVSVAAAFIISPSLQAQRVPEIGREDLGRPFHSSSPSGFKASRDYEIVDRTLTEKHRQEARATVRPVYDFNRAVLGDLRQTIREGFGSAQGVVVQSERQTADTSATQFGDEGNGAQMRKRKKPESAQAAADESLANRLWSERRSFEQKLSPLEDEDFQALVNARFSREVEQATLALIERAYHAPLAISREELSQVGSQGITIRMLSGGSEQASSAAAPSVNDVREAKNELERFVSASPSFLPDAPAPLRRAVLRLAKRQLRPNLTINIAETEARRD